MIKLDCSVVSCSYNSNNSCKRENITVGGSEARKPSETACKSFAPKGTNTMTSLDNAGPSKNTNVACDAVTCRYNKNKVCDAGHIAIAGVKAMTNGETECGTFQAK